MNSKLLILPVLLLLVGCRDRVAWRMEQEPTTDAERKAIAEHVEKILRATPETLSGHDQDWDDAINAAEYRATELFARRVMREWVVTFDGIKIRPTGRWYYLDEVPPIKPETAQP